MIFVLLHWYNDFKEGHTRWYSCFWLVFYPVWRVIKLLRFYKDEDKLNEEKTKYQESLGTLEAFTESVIQVCVAILVNKVYTQNYFKK